VTLYATRKAADYQAASGASCGTISTTSGGCTAFITVTGVNAGIEAEGTNRTQGTIDGRGDLPILGTSASWWQNAVTAKAEGRKQVNPRLILVNRNLIDGRDAAGTESSIAAGIRIKSYAGAGGKVTDVYYISTRMLSLKNPVDIDPFYDPPAGPSAPYFAHIEIDNATETDSVSGAESVLEGYSAAYPLGLTLRDVRFDTTATRAQDANIAEIGSDLAISGPGVVVSH
jgi:hypothetical protein